MSIEMPEIKRLFMLFHGMYGNQLLDKFRTGQISDEGEDMGLVGAQGVWLNGLREFDFDTIRKAVAMCEQKHKTFTPSLLEFRDLCKACRPRKAPETIVPQIGMSDEMKAKIKQQNRVMLANLKLGASTRVDYGNGMPALLLMVAKAIGDAGGDEVKSLLSLESKFIPRA